MAPLVRRVEGVVMGMRAIAVTGWLVIVAIEGARSDPETRESKLIPPRSESTARDAAEPNPSRPAAWPASGSEMSSEVNVHADDAAGERLEECRREVESGG
jgi:hypothetical protein